MGLHTVIDQARYAEWVRLSHRLAKFQTFMVVTAQGLGKLDAELMAQDREYLQKPESERLNIQNSLDFHDRIVTSYLWVLGAYELIRSINQICEKDLTLLDSENLNKVRSAKLFFARVRVPLAKFEPAAKFKDTDSAIAYPALSYEHGIAWKVSTEVFIARGELSECLINLFREI